ncbi:MAG TPA: VTT domain-containing protein [Gammaproteobacteria bacterium]|jgi:uncharacterized membrane protein YdjX (TVP38/TMEM64 family)
MTRRGRLRMAIFLAAVVAIAVFYAVFARHWLSVDSLRSHRDALLQFTASHYWEALCLATVGCLVLVALSVPVSGIFMLLCGMLFGRGIGTALMAVVVSLGATLAVLIVRYLAQDFVRGRLRGRRKAQKLLRQLGQNQDSYLLFLRVAPWFPFWLTNILYGLTAMPAWRFLLLTLVGILPDAFIYDNVGAHLATLRSSRDLLSPTGILALALLAVLCLCPVLIHELQRRKLLRPGWPLRRAQVRHAK